LSFNLDLEACTPPETELCTRSGSTNGLTIDWLDAIEPAPGEGNPGGVGDVVPGGGVGLGAFGFGSFGGGGDGDSELGGSGGGGPLGPAITHPLYDENILKNNTTLYEIKTSFKAKSNQ
jgi:hypothetical protein